MSRPPRARFLFALGLLAAGSCAGSHPRGKAWDRLDLTRIEPRVVAPAAPVSPPYLDVLGALGGEEVRDLRKVPRASLERIPRQSAARVRALRQVAGSELSWEVEVGREPFFSFIPLAEEHPCSAWLQVSAEDGRGREVPLYRSAAPTRAAPAAAQVTVDLGPWAGKRVDLHLAVEPTQGPPGSCTVLWGSPSITSHTQAPPPPPGTSVLLIGADTLRADALGAWGRRPSLTPALDQLAEESDVYLDAFSTFNITNPSFASLLTGLYGKHHRVYDLKTPLPEKHRTLAEVFADAGYDTFAAISAPHLAPEFSGLGQGFREVRFGDGQTAAELATDQLRDWLAERRDHPFFAWLHLFDPHTPHTPPEPYALGYRAARPSGVPPPTAWVSFRVPGPRTFREQILGGHFDLYDGEVAYLDRQVDRVLGYLADRGLLETTVVAFVADHGENLEEHGVRYRHTGLWDTTTHVPLLVRWPGERRSGRRIPGLVEHLDLFPTLLGAAGLEPPPQDGRDLRELARRGGRQAVFAEDAEDASVSVRTRRYRYTVVEQSLLYTLGPHLFDLREDPAEERNLAGSGLPEEAELDAALEAWRMDRGSGGPAPRPRTLSPEEEERLRALGYQ